MLVRERLGAAALAAPAMVPITALPLPVHHDLQARVTLDYLFSRTQS